MPPCRKNKRTGGSTRNQGNRRQTCSGSSEINEASTTTPSSKKRQVQPPLTNDNISAIVEAVHAILPALTSPPTSTMKGAMGTGSSSQ